MGEAQAADTAADDDYMEWLRYRRSSATGIRSADWKLPLCSHPTTVGSARQGLAPATS